jgi:NAD(P)-dependent dehydrogenase (short-subunit alcohol dehydrogenase family)
VGYDRSNGNGSENELERVCGSRADRPMALDCRQHRQHPTSWAAEREQKLPVPADAAVAALPVKRMGEAIEVARTLAFLASAGGDYITGTTIFIDGGKHLARPAK